MPIYNNSIVVKYTDHFDVREIFSETDGHLETVSFKNKKDGFYVVFNLDGCTVRIGYSKSMLKHRDILSLGMHIPFDYTGDYSVSLLLTGYQIY